MPLLPMPSLFPQGPYPIPSGSLLIHMPPNTHVQAGLQLEFVYGYAGKYNTASNLFWTADGKIVYYVAAVGIVYNPETHTQDFFHVSVIFPRLQQGLGTGSLWPFHS